MFPELQISMLKLFLEDPVTLKTGVMIAENHRNKLYFKMY